MHPSKMFFCPTIIIVMLFSFLLLRTSFAKKSNDNEGLGIVYQEDFKNWRDNSTDLGFNTQVQVQGRRLKISTPNVAYGKAMSKADPITINITRKTEIVIKVDRIAPDTIATVYLMHAYEPYNSYRVAKLQGKSGEYKANVHELTGWKGVTSMWIKVWLEGEKKSVIIKEVFFQDANILEKQRKLAAIKAFTLKKFAPMPPNSIFFEDFRNGVGGWRTAETDPEFGSELNFEGDVPRLKIIPGRKYCKLMSDSSGIKAKITPSTKFEIAFGDMGTSKVKVELMLAQAPYTNYTLMPFVTRPGVYTVNINEKTKWRGAKVFWIQIWMGTTGAPETEAGAGIKYIHIRN